MSGRVRPNLGQTEGWLVVFDPGLAAKLSHEGLHRSDKAFTSSGAR